MLKRKGGKPNKGWVDTFQRGTGGRAIPFSSTHEYFECLGLLFWGWGGGGGILKKG